MLLPDDPHVYAFTRRLGDEALLVLANFTGEHQPIDGSTASPTGPTPTSSSATSTTPPTASASCARGRPSCAAGPAERAVAMIR